MKECVNLLLKENLLLKGLISFPLRNCAFERKEEGSFRLSNQVIDRNKATEKVKRGLLKNVMLKGKG